MCSHCLKFQRSLFLAFQEKEKEKKKRAEAEKSKRKPVVDINAGLWQARVFARIL